MHYPLSLKESPLFSNAYTDVPVDTWSAEWDDADVSDVQIEGNDTKLYSNLVFAGIEFTSQTIDASEMSYFHMDIWTADSTDPPAIFKIKLVDFGADGIWGGDDVEHEITLTATTDPALESESWVALDIPLSTFTNLTTKEHLAQLIISGDLSTLYIDNIYFHDGAVSNEDSSSIPVPAMLGNSYPNPFKPISNIDFSIEKSAHVSLKIYDVKGRLVETLVDQVRSANTYHQAWNAEGHAPGVYFYRLSVDNKVVDTKRMVLLN